MVENMDEDGQGNEAEQIRRKKIEAMFRAQQQDAAIRNAMARLLEADAYGRLMNVRMANPELYVKVVNSILHMARRVGRKLTERELLTLLASLTERKETDIKIHRK